MDQLFDPVERRIHSEAQQKLHRLLQPMNSSQQLRKWLILNCISGKSFKFEFLNPQKQILGSLPPPPYPKLMTALG